LNLEIDGLTESMTEKEKPQNLLNLRLDARLQTALNKLSGNNNQLPATYVLKVLVEHCKNELSQEAYEELIERYSKTIEQQVKEKELKQQLREEKERLAQEFRLRELALKEQNAETYKEMSPEQREIAELKRLYEMWSERLNGDYSHTIKENARRNLAEIEQKLTKKGILIPFSTIQTN
jgi:hypothetical protein